ncbi:MAG: DUF2442 domain-containing protein [Methylococcaceae bacterium]
MNPRVTAVDVLENYKLRITFANHEVRIFDVEPYLIFPAFTKLQNTGYFSLVKAVHGTVCWPNDIDFCPDTVYLKSVTEKNGDGSN